MNLKYVIFETGWGYFGLAGSENGIFRSCLPFHDEKKVKDVLTAGQDCEYDGKAFSEAVNAVKAYFKGTCNDFMKLELDLGKMTPFQVRVLRECAQIPAGKVLTYSQLAGKIGRPKATRAVGSALGANPIPLLIPCHRVLRTDGQMGGFSAIGGVELKKRLLEHEKQIASA